MLKLLFTRISNTHHRFEYIRDDGTGESAELETKTFLFHDFIHYCIESEAHLSEGFFGLLDQGRTYAELSKKMESQDDTGAAMDVERVTGAFTALAHNEGTIAGALSGLQNIYDAYGTPLPAWISEDMLEKALARYKSLLGEWGSLSFGETLELTFNK